MHRLLILTILLLSACGGEPPARPAEPPAAAARVALVRSLLDAARPVPGPILDAHAFEEKLGDGELGPSDYRSYVYLRVAPQDVERWTRGFLPAAGAAEYAEPAEARPWWVGRGRFPALEFYDPRSLSHRGQGWIGVSRETGEIYLYTYTS